MKQSGCRIVWQEAPASGHIEVAHGTLLECVVAGEGTRKRETRKRETRKRETRSGDFQFSEGSGGALHCTFRDANLDAGAFATRVGVQCGERSFSFFLRDVSTQSPVYNPLFGVAVLPADDARSYREIESEVRSRNLVSQQQRIEAEPEESYENACDATRHQIVPTWLGLGRDMRLFAFSYSPELGFWGEITPRYHSMPQQLPETGDAPASVSYCIGRGAGCRVDITRHLEEGALPILRSCLRDGEVEYHLTALASLETQPLSREAVSGTDHKTAYAHMGVNILGEDERARVHAEYSEDLKEREEVVCLLRIEAVNTASVPRYAFFKAMQWQHLTQPAHYESETGFHVLASGRIGALHKLNGRAMPQSEIAILLQPGETVTAEYSLPHQPLSHKRAQALARLDFQIHLDAARAYWNEKLNAGARFHLPEAAIDERVRAGLLHLDINTIGSEPRGTLATAVGWYAPIGSESSPMIQFFDAMGRHDIAERAIDFFLKRQRPDGFMHNYEGYQLETGPALWTMGEHFRYTRDKNWVRRIKPNLLKACEYLMAWRARNQRDELRGNGYGLLDGKVADPNDFYHSFMLNGLSYLGMARVVEMLEAIGDKKAPALKKEVELYRDDIRTAYRESVAKSPLVPLSDGRWLPSFAPWTEYPGPVSLFAEGAEWMTHGTFLGRDSLIGALYLVIGEVLEPNEWMTDALLRVHQELQTNRNAGFSQPYYCRHDFIHLQRGEVKPFLKTYYNQMTALQDRETYSFWEHYYRVSEHKTHEEAWFLMQTRWMLYMEQGSQLRLLPAIPRRWLRNGETIELNNAASYFGAFNLHVQSHLADNTITARLEFLSTRKPDSVALRLPHSDGRKAVSCSHGTYDATSETVHLTKLKRMTELTLQF